MTDDLIARLLAVDYSAPHNELCRDAAAALSAARQELAAAQQFVRVDLSKPEDYRRLEAERDALREALQIIAGERPCIDNLMSDKEIARAALAAQVKP